MHKNIQLLKMNIQKIKKRANVDLLFLFYKLQVSAVEFAFSIIMYRLFGIVLFL